MPAAFDTPYKEILCFLNLPKTIQLKPLKLDMSRIGTLSIISGRRSALVCGTLTSSPFCGYTLPLTCRKQRLIISFILIFVCHCKLSKFRALRFCIQTVLRIAQFAWVQRRRRVMFISLNFCKNTQIYPYDLLIYEAASRPSMSAAGPCWVITSRFALLSRRRRFTPAPIDCYSAAPLSPVLGP